MKKLAIIGATGLVGQTTLCVLKEENLIDKFDVYLIVSNRSAGKVIVFDEKHYNLFELNEEILDLNFDFALFVAQEDISKVWVKRFAERGTVVIDNSSIFRLKENVPLIVPEINFDCVKCDEKIIANPNCSTIQLVVVLDRFKKLAKIKKVVVSSYQSVSGAGKEALQDLIQNKNDFFKCGIQNNIIAQIGYIQENGNCTEENKIINETKKILSDNFEVVATTVRVPISFCHGESVYVEFCDEIDFSKLKSVLKCDYIALTDDLFYPKQCAGSNLTYVFRLRKTGKNSVAFFVIADNLRRGASYNAVKILENLLKKSDVTNNLVV